MERHKIIERIGKQYFRPNIENGEYSYVVEAGSKAELENRLGHSFHHFKLDLRFEKDDVVLLIETKQRFVDADSRQLAEYLEEEKALHPDKKIICILANTKNDNIKVWQSAIDDDHFLANEKILGTMEYYSSLFYLNKQNDREKVLKNTYALNELLHKKDIDEALRSQFVGTVLLHIKDLLKRLNITKNDKKLKERIAAALRLMSEAQIIAGIKDTLTKLLDNSDNKNKKIELLQKNILDNQKIKALRQQDWIDIIGGILTGIYIYIDTNSSEGQDILNLFFIAFNKYSSVKPDRNQAFTPDHITEFMCRLTEVDCTKRVLDGTCGSASFLVQAMVKELADCIKPHLSKEQIQAYQQNVKEKNIYGIEIEEKAFGLSVTNMLIHGDGNSNIKLGSCFDHKAFIKQADPDIILMNPPYNAKPINIPDLYKSKWDKKAKDGKDDPTKGLVFVHYFSDVIKELNEERIKNGMPPKFIKLAVLLPLSCAIGTDSLIAQEKEILLKDNTLEAVFSLPSEIFYPGASVNVCCMLFTLGQPHIKSDGNARSTFFGYCKDDGFVKKKNLGRVEQFAKDDKGNFTVSKWKEIEKEWLDLFERKAAVDGKSAVKKVTAADEWLCEAYMKTDYSKLTAADFQRTLNNYLSYLVKEGHVYEDNSEE